MPQGLFQKSWLPKDIDIQRVSLDSPSFVVYPEIKATEAKRFSDFQNVSSVAFIFLDNEMKLGGIS